MLASTLCDAATVLAEAARATPSEARAYHPAGMADAAGFVAMDTNELLVHTNDILDGIDPGSHLPSTSPFSSSTDSSRGGPGGPARGGAGVGQRTGRPARSRQPGAPPGCGTAHLWRSGTGRSRPGTQRSTGPQAGREGALVAS